MRFSKRLLTLKKIAIVVILTAVYSIINFTDVFSNSHNSKKIPWRDLLEYKHNKNSLYLQGNAAVMNVQKMAGKNASPTSSFNISNKYLRLVSDLGNYSVTCIDRMESIKSYDTVFKKWLGEAVSLCTDSSKQFIAYGKEFALLKWAVVDPHQFDGPVGGEDIAQLINQKENSEYYQFKPGCFALQCIPNKKYRFNGGKNHMNYYIQSVSSSSVFSSNSNYDHQFSSNLSFVNKDAKFVKQPEFTIAVTRYEYVNLYHTMTDWYNAYLMMNFFNRTSIQTHILIIDAHPFGALDRTWSVLFNSSRRVKQAGKQVTNSAGLPTKLVFPELVWSILGYSSPMYVTSTLTSLPLVEEFRHFFLTRHCVNPHHVIDCNNLNVFFIWRHDYVAHPRNPTGKIQRKIANEDEILQHTIEKYPNFNVTGFQLDTLSMDEQLRFIAKTDILIGMHGAGLTHAMFLPKHASLIELAPSGSSRLKHFSKIANWRGLHYKKWVNTNKNNENVLLRTTYIGTSTIDSLIQTSVRALCSG